jgi:hypothetical protein
MATKKKTLAQRIAADPKLKAKYLNNPGLRSKLPDSALTPALRKQRTANAYAKTPITPGSGVTNAMLARETANAQTVKYGQAETALKEQGLGTMQLARNEQDWYGGYQRELAQHAANTQAINAQANAANLALQQGITGIGQSQVAGIQQGANVDAASRGTTAANLGPEANAALGVRQQMAQGLGAQQVATGAAQSRYADTMAGVVAPTQKLQALQQAGRDFQGVLKQGQGLAREKGAYGEQYKSQRVADEFKNVLAQQTLGLDAQKAAATVQTAAANRAETRRAHKASETVAQGNLSVSKSRAQLAAEKDAVQRQNKTGPYAPARGVSSAAHDRKVVANTKTRSQINTATSDAKYLRGQKIAILGPDGKPETGKDGKPTGRKRALTREEIRANLRKRYKDADVADAAIELAELGHVQSRTRDKLRKRGIGVPKAWLPKTAKPTGGTVGELARGGVSLSKKPPVPLR